eukprot:scaffold170649_cov19-Tisochrysis_lutea.AAC.2
MEIGKYAGRKVSEVKGIIKEEMLASGGALAYSEPEKVGGQLHSYALLLSLRASVCFSFYIAPLDTCDHDL